MTTSRSGHEPCSVNYEASYVYGTFREPIPRPKISKCSRPVLQDGKCILHAKIAGRMTDFDQALVDEVRALGIPFVYDVDFSPFNAGFLDAIISAVADGSGTRMAKFEKCLFPAGVFWGGSCESTGFYDCNFRGVQFMGGEETPASYEFFRCRLGDFEAREATVSSLNLHGSYANNVVIRIVADSVSLRGASLAGRLEISSSTIRTLDLAYMSVEDWSKVRVSGVTHPKGVRVSAVGSAMSDSTFFGVDWMQRDNGGLLLADEEAIRKPVVAADSDEQLRPEACQALTMAAVAQTYRNFIDVFERTRQYDLAEECFVAAMDVQSEDRHLSRTHRAAIHIYNLASRYGSSYVRAALVLLLLLGMFMSLYSLPPTNVRFADAKQAWTYTGPSAYLRRLGGATLHSLEVATFLKKPPVRDLHAGREGCRSCRNHPSSGAGGTLALRPPAKVQAINVLFPP